MRSLRSRRSRRWSESSSTVVPGGRRLGRQRHRRRDRPGRRDEHAGADRGAGPHELRRVRALPAAHTQAVHRGRKFAPTFRAALQPLRTRLGRERAYGALAHADIDDLVTEWLKPALTNSTVRDDLRRLTASLNQATTVQAAERLPRFTKPALIAWSRDDAFFPLEDGRRLAATLPDARLEVIHGARTFSMIDQPDTLAGLIADFADGRVGRRAA